MENTLSDQQIGQTVPTGLDLHHLASRLFPINRSMTGNGVRESLAILSEHIPLTMCEVPSGTKVLDWTVPDEWNVRDAYVMDETGQRIIDWRQNNLHLVNGSMPLNTRLRWDELKQKLHTLPSRPDLIPYRTCFFKEDWGFCLGHQEFLDLDAKPNATYQVVIDTTVDKGALTYGECIIPGQSVEEVLLYAHICHPSLANDNLSGIVVATFLAQWLQQYADRQLTYRVVFAPATIGAITWLHQNRDRLDRIRHGLVLSLLGGPGAFTYKCSRSGVATIDRVTGEVFVDLDLDHTVRDFEPIGYDERQFCSPGIDLPVGCLMRTPYGEFEAYHTSADNLSFITPALLEDALSACQAIILALEEEETYRSLKPYGEPFLRDTGLYESTPKDANRAQFQKAVQWVLNLSDGKHSLRDIAKRSMLDEGILHGAAIALKHHGIIQENGEALRLNT